MITLLDIKNSICNLLANKYDYKIYGNEKMEGCIMPSFFVQILPKKFSNDTVNFYTRAYNVKITYFQEEFNDDDNLMKIDEIRDLLGYRLHVGTRGITVSDFSFGYNEKLNDVLQIEFVIEYVEQVQREEKQLVMSELFLNDKNE